MSVVVDPFAGAKVIPEFATTLLEEEFCSALVTDAPVEAEVAVSVDVVMEDVVLGSLEAGLGLGLEDKPAAVGEDVVL